MTINRLIVFFIIPFLFIVTEGCRSKKRINKTYFQDRNERGTVGKQKQINKIELKNTNRIRAKNNQKTNNLIKKEIVKNETIKNERTENFGLPKETEKFGSLEFPISIIKAIDEDLFKNNSLLKDKKLTVLNCTKTNDTRTAEDDDIESESLLSNLFSSRQKEVISELILDKLSGDKNNSSDQTLTFQEQNIKTKERTTNATLELSCNIKKIAQNIKTHELLFVFTKTSQEQVSELSITNESQQSNWIIQKPISQDSIQLKISTPMQEVEIKEIEDEIIVFTESLVKKQNEKPISTFSNSENLTVSKVTDPSDSNLEINKKSSEKSKDGDKDQK